MIDPDSQTLGDDGKITAADIPVPLDEAMVTGKALEMSETWIREEQAKGKDMSKWIEGGLVNPLKFHPDATTNPPASGAN